MKRNWAILTMLLAASAIALPAQAQFSSRGAFSDRAVKEVFRDRRPLNNMFSLPLDQGPAAPPTTTVSLTTGVAYTDTGGDTTTTALPNELEVDFKDQVNILLVDMDAHDWIRTPDGRVSGAGDPSVTLLHKFGDAFALAGTVGVPTGSAVSGNTAFQSVAAIYNIPLSDRDGLRLSAQVAHTNEDTPGVSAYTKGGKVNYKHTFKKGLDVYTSVAYSATSGAGHSTVGAVGLDFPIPDTFKGPFSSISGTLSGTCSLNSGSRCGTVEFDLVLNF